MNVETHKENYAQYRTSRTIIKQNNSIVKNQSDMTVDARRRDVSSAYKKNGKEPLEEDEDADDGDDEEAYESNPDDEDEEESEEEDGYDEE
ncbi:hypothetical protein QYE76_031307 [Lolium multiflorum]|uniref:Uncharacterized protein n=1 Tax=Lolium multiflorum TaxID=4521 RepID=A0AAD8QUT0_LOLMU|nr:hypothetical protein QYE76_031307 [Lolium multiflorum]